MNAVMTALTLALGSVTETARVYLYQGTIRTLVCTPYNVAAAKCPTGANLMRLIAGGLPLCAGEALLLRAPRYTPSTHDRTSRGCPPGGSRVRFC